MLLHYLVKFDIRAFFMVTKVTLNITVSLFAKYMAVYDFSSSES